MRGGWEPFVGKASHQESHWGSSKSRWDPGLVLSTNHKRKGKLAFPGEMAESRPMADPAQHSQSHPAEPGISGGVGPRGLGSRMKGLHLAERGPFHSHMAIIGGPGRRLSG